MKIMRVAALIYGVEDVAAGIRFFEDRGLPCVEKGVNGAEFRMASGQSIVIRPATDASLPAAPDGGSTLREAIWGVEDAACPCGGRTEYYADMDPMNDNWKPRIWEKNPGFAMWMLERADAPELSRI